MPKIKLKTICAKEKVWRLLIAFAIIFAAIFLVLLPPVIRAIGLFLAIYLIITALIGGCLIYSVFK